MYNLLLQVLDDGRLTDNKGRTANFRNTIIIMTSNLGAHLIQRNIAEIDEFAADNNREEVIARTKLELFELLKQAMPPEFLNRIDDVIMFTPLTRGEIKEIVRLQLLQLSNMLQEREVTLTFSEAAIDWLAQIGYDPQFGARPLKRVIQRKIINELSKQLLADQISRNTTIQVDANEEQNEIFFRNLERQEKV